jgi:hypothetical protein
MLAQLNRSGLVTGAFLAVNKKTAREAKTRLRKPIESGPQKMKKTKKTC